MRICSLLPSATDIVGALGLTGALVGRSAECDWPPEVRDLPVVTAARVDTDALGSLEIDRAVREALADGRSLYALDQKLIEELAPDVILTQDLCAVCAVSRDDVSRLCGVDAAVLSFDPRGIVGIEDSVRELAGHLGVPERGEGIVAEMEQKIGRVGELVPEPVRVFVAEWLDPPFASGALGSGDGRARRRPRGARDRRAGVVPNDVDGGARAGARAGRPRSMRLRRNAHRP